MALTATLTADFSSFVEAAQDGVVALNDLKATANTTGKMLDAMAEGYDTAGAVTETTQLTAALAQVKITATTTAPAIDQVGTASKGAAGKSTEFKTAFDQVDKSLAAAGISLGPLPGMLDELATSAGKSVSEIGLLGTAGAVVAAGMAGWNIGTMIGEFTGLTDWISRTTAAAMGWGDVAAQEAAAASDTLARASAIAGREITTMAEALRILGDAAKVSSDEQKKLAAEIKLEEAAAAQFATVVAKLFGYDDINRAELYRQALGNIENVTKLTTEKKKELHDAVTAALDAYTALGEKAPPALLAIQAATTELIKVNASFSAASSGMWVQFAAGVDDGKQRMADIAAAAKLTWEDIGGVSREMLEQMATDAEEKYAVALAASDHFTPKQIANFREAAAEARAAVDAWGTETLEAYDAIQAASTVTADQQIADARRASAATVTSWHEAMSAVAAGQGTMSGTVGGAIDTGPTARAAIQKAYDEGRYYGPVVNVSEANPRGTGPNWAALGFRAAGGPVNAGQPYMVGERGPELFVPREAGNIRAHGAGGGAITVNISTVMGNPQEIARVVSAALVDAARARGDRLPIG